MLMELGMRFRDAIADTSRGTQIVGPSAIARAAAAALDLDGAGIALADRLMRLPLGSSSPHAAQAEQLQATLGDGPCLDAGRTSRLVVAGEEELGERWPLYSVELLRKTPFRAVAALPLSEPGGVFASLNLYSTDPARPSLPAATDLESEIAVPAADLLLGTMNRLGDLDTWVGDHIRRSMAETGSADNLGARLDVWTAVGMVMEAGSLDDADALALLRGYAYRRDLALDFIGAALIHRRLAPIEVLRAPV